MGYELLWSDRIGKEQRKEERRKIADDVKAGKPPIAINLRIAPEWGVIAGYLENGKEFLCRTYFDKAVFTANRQGPEFLETMQKTGGYLSADCWPFAIAHFGSKIERSAEKVIFINSLQAKIDSMAITERRGYLMGYHAYNAWIEGLLNDDFFENVSDKDVIRRLQVNDYQLINLLDARRCAVQYLKDSTVLIEGNSAELLSQMTALYEEIVDKLSAFYHKLQNHPGVELKYMESGLIQSIATSTKDLRKEEALLLSEILELEYKSDVLAKEVLKNEAV